METTWFILWGLLWAIYFMLDGFDLGTGILLPFIAKNDAEKRILLSSLGPFWDGNEVWLITAGGITFAAFPAAYATLFSALYTPLMIILFGLIFRGVSLEFRNKHDSTLWHSFWDGCFFIGSFLPTFLLGVAFANIFMGIPIDSEGIYRGSLLTFLNPYGLTGGMLFLFLFLLHGAIWISARTVGSLQERASSAAMKLWGILVIFSVLFLLLSASYTNLYENYSSQKLLFLIPASTVLSLFITRHAVVRSSFGAAWVFSALTIWGATFFGIAGLYPNLLPSSLDPTFHITIYNSAASPLALKIMLTVTFIFIPVVIAYQIWVYRLFAGKMTENTLDSDETY